MKVNSLKYILLLFLVGCSGPYSDLEKSYPKKNSPKEERIPPRKINLGSHHHKGSFTYGNVNELVLDESAVFISLNSFFHEPVEIPLTRVTACSCTWFNKGNWYTNLLLGQDGVRVGIHLSDETKDWCYAKNLPIIKGDKERDWLYDKTPLPTFEDYQQVSKEEYEKLFRRSCQGF